MMCNLIGCTRINTFKKSGDSPLTILCKGCIYSGGAYNLHQPLFILFRTGTCFFISPPVLFYCIFTHFMLYFRQIER